MEDLRLKVGYLKRRLKEELKGWLEGRLKGGLTSSKPLPPSLPCFKFFLPLHCPLSGGSGKSLYMWPGLASLAPTTYTKTCPAYATPFVPTLLKTASPERLLRPPLASSPASNFFSLYNAPLSGGLRQLFVYVAKALPTLPPCFTFFFPLHRPLSEGLTAKQAPATYTKTCPAYATPFVPTLPKTPSPERLLRPPLPSSPASNSFSLYTAPSQEASGKSLYMWPGLASPERLRRPPPTLPCFKFFLPLHSPSPEALG